MQIFRKFHPNPFFSSWNPLLNKFRIRTWSICWSRDPKCSSNMACTYFRVLFLACDGRRRGDPNEDNVCPYLNGTSIYHFILVPKNFANCYGDNTPVAHLGLAKAHLHCNYLDWSRNYLFWSICYFLEQWLYCSEGQQIVSR